MFPRRRKAMGLATGKKLAIKRATQHRQILRTGARLMPTPVPILERKRKVCTILLRAVRNTKLTEDWLAYFPILRPLPRQPYLQLLARTGDDSKRFINAMDRMVKVLSPSIAVEHRLC